MQQFYGMLIGSLFRGEAFSFPQLTPKWLL
jgi:hypothetical protein